MNGVIWSKMQGTFVSISSVPTYALMQQERFRQSRALETYNFKLQNLTLTYFQESNFFEFYDNDKKVSGLYGELWTLLAESLNFTLYPIRANVNINILENHTLHNGLENIIWPNETIAIPRLETHGALLEVADYTMPLRMNRHRVYIRNKAIYDNTWMVKVFSWELWCTVLIMYVLLTVCSFWSQNLLARIRAKYKRTSFGEHFFYNFGVLCNQSYIPEHFDGRSKILEVSLNLFSSVMYMAFNAVLFIYMTKRVFILPFNDLDSLVNNTKYSVVALKNSMGEITFQEEPEQAFVLLKTTKRFVIASSTKEMFKMACLSTKVKYAIFLGEDQYKRGAKICRLNPTGKSYLHMWIASAIVKNFKHKRTIDLGILRLKEVGLWKAIMERWWIWKVNEIDDIDTPDAIVIQQVSLVIAVMFCGLITAFIIFIIENIVFVYKIKQS